MNEPKNKLNHYILGVLNRTAGKFDVAITSFEKALVIDENYVDALFDLGATYYNWGVDMIKQAQESGSDSEEFKQKFTDALPHLEKVTTIKTDDPSVWETLGTIYARLGKSDKAIDALDKADQIRKGN
jgi:tetratricopeptide (TPR) repeat protein